MVKPPIWSPAEIKLYTKNTPPPLKERIERLFSDTRLGVRAIWELPNSQPAKLVSAIELVYFAHKPVKNHKASKANSAKISDKASQLLALLAKEHLIGHCPVNALVNPDYYDQTAEQPSVNEVLEALKNYKTALNAVKSRKIKEKLIWSIYSYFMEYEKTPWHEHTATIVSIILDTQDDTSVVTQAVHRYKQNFEAHNKIS